MPKPYYMVHFVADNQQTSQDIPMYFKRLESAINACLESSDTFYVVTITDMANQPKYYIWHDENGSLKHCDIDDAAAKLWHPYYCVGCGEIFKDEPTYQPHYQECFLEVEDMSYEEVVSRIHNPKNY